MSSSWPLVAMGEVLTERHEAPSYDDIESGRVPIIAKIGFNDGKIQLRTDTATKTGMILIRQGDLVVSGINAAKGAIAISEICTPIAGTIHYGAYIPNREKVSTKFLWWLLRSNTFRELLDEFVPGGIKTELKAKRFLPIPVHLPPLSEQQRIVGRIEELKEKIYEAHTLREKIVSDLNHLLMSAYHLIADSAPRLPLSDVAPLCRRPVVVDVGKNYPQVAVRSFGKGTFHKPPLSGGEVTWQKPFLVKADDILISNIKAWEGALAVALPEDDERFGSHRYLTLVPKAQLATSRFVCFHLLTPEGMHHVGEASPGSADRNRTLNSKALMRIQIPVPSYEQQLWFDELCHHVATVKRLHVNAAVELDALLPSILDKAFKGEL